MSFERIGQLPAPEELRTRFPLSPAQSMAKSARDAEIRRIISGKDDRILLIIGPCSADREDAVLDYVGRLANMQEEVRDRLLLIPRIYTRKPRTSGQGYQGIAHQPDPQQAPDPIEGLVAMRRLHLRVLETSGLTAADEMLYPSDWPYLEDLLSYLSVGARSVENPQHRLTASGPDIPVGIKNPTNGDLSVMLHAIDAARNPQTCILGDAVYTTTGNPLAHAVLRGATDVTGVMIPNYQKSYLEKIRELSGEYAIQAPSVIIDTNHSNSGKQAERQPQIAREILTMRKEDPRMADLIKGFMIESYLEEGCQAINGTPLVYGKSITDPCLGWAGTESLIREIAEKA